ncbi:Reverse transcriptase RNA-dependent DNA polymerase [Penicillium cf. griseofulvum]|nr:Reverse transcriptase RNA-dependent DNA polymerase [Penicillium cf. griseofulvum]
MMLLPSSKSVLNRRLARYWLARISLPCFWVTGELSHVHGPHHLNKKQALIGFYALEDDVYAKGEGESAWFLLVHVDDFIAAAPTDENIDQFFQLVKGEFEIKDMG